MKEAIINNITPTGRYLIQPNQHITVELFNSYINFLDVSAASVGTYTRAIRQFINYLSARNITQPTREDIILYRDNLKERLKATTVQCYITALRLFFTWLEQQGFYPNIAEHIKGAKVDNQQHKKDRLTPAQTREILNGMEKKSTQGARNFAIFRLMVTCGLRDIEVARANIEDLTTRGGNPVLYIQGKGREDKGDFVKLPKETARAIRDYLKHRGNPAASEPLFISTSNRNKAGRLSTRTISGIIKNTLIKAGYESDRLTAHSLRHTAVTAAILSGESIVNVKSFARHKRIDTTMVYIHGIDRDANTCAASVENAIMQG